MSIASKMRTTVAALTVSGLAAVTAVKEVDAATFDYSGNPLTSILDPSLGNQITGSVTFDASVTNNYTGTVYANHVLAYSISSVDYTLNQSNSTPSSLFQFTLTDGAISSWDFSAITPNLIQLVTVGQGYQGNQSFDWARNVETGPLNSNYGNPGTWSEVSPVPLPGALLLFGPTVVLLGVAGAAAARRRSAQPPALSNG